MAAICYTLHRCIIQVETGAKMFKIILIDIGGDGKKVEFDTCVDTLPQAEQLAGKECSEHLGTNEVSLIHEEDLVYEVIAVGCSVGWCVIKSL